MSRTTLVALAGALVALATAGPAAADEQAQASAGPNTILMKGGIKTLRFVGPETIVQGEELEIVNETNAKKVGPHTLSLVEQSLLPKTKPAVKQCFAPKHICKAIADWHGVKGNGPVTKNPVEVGEPGWDTMGSLSKKGDSWFTGIKAGASFTQAVTATPGTELHFLCAIHPWMKGSIEVLPPIGG